MSSKKLLFLVKYILLLLYCSWQPNMQCVIGKFLVTFTLYCFHNECNEPFSCLIDRHDKIALVKEHDVIFILFHPLQKFSLFTHAHTCIFNKRNVFTHCKLLASQSS